LFDLSYNPLSYGNTSYEINVPNDNSHATSQCENCTTECIKMEDRETSRCFNFCNVSRDMGKVLHKFPCIIKDVRFLFSEKVSYVSCHKLFMDISNFSTFGIKLKKYISMHVRTLLSGFSKQMLSSMSQISITSAC
jgi:hypothetical protein